MNTPSYPVPEKLQRCSWLFLSLLSLIMLLPFLHYVPHGRTVLSLLQWSILLTALLAIGRSRHSFFMALSLVLLSAILHGMNLIAQEPFFLLLSRICSMAVYGITIVALLNYVLLQSVMDSDRLFGAASIYLMLGILWTFLYGLLLEHDVHAFNNLSQELEQPINNVINVLYFSFTTLTTTGYGDITPLSPMARMLANVEQVTGTLFVAILIARLVGFYSPPKPPTSVD